MSQDDFELRRLLQQWKAPETPASLELRVLGSVQREPPEGLHVRTPETIGGRSPALSRRWGKFQPAGGLQSALGKLRRPWWRFLLTGYIRVPVSAVLLLALLVTGVVWRFAIQPSPPCSVDQAASATAAPPAPLVLKDLSERCGHRAPGSC